MRALRIAHGLGVNQLGVAVGIEPANLSRFERGMPGGVHAAKHLDLIAARLNTRASVLYAIAEMTASNMKILDNPDELLNIATDLTVLLDRYLVLPDEARKKLQALISSF